MSAVEDLKRLLFEAGIVAFGAADVEPLRAGFNLPEKVRSRFPRALSLGFRLSDGILETIDDAPNAIYSHHYRQANFLLDRAATLAAARLQALGAQALPVPASQLIDHVAHRGHVSHKHVARQAGLGWIGRNNLLVSPEHGSRLRLVTILTDLPLETAEPLDFGCGSCRACLASCPARAIRERPEDFDHRVCYDKLHEFQTRGLVGQHICGVCVKACRGPRAVVN